MNERGGGKGKQVKTSDVIALLKRLWMVRESVDLGIDDRFFSLTKFFSVKFPTSQESLRTIFCIPPQRRKCYRRDILCLIPMREF